MCKNQEVEMEWDVKIMNDLGMIQDDLDEIKELFLLNRITQLELENKSLKGEVELLTAIIKS